jgi:hypothetical protein
LSTEIVEKLPVVGSLRALDAIIAIAAASATASALCEEFSNMIVSLFSGTEAAPERWSRPLGKRFTASEVLFSIDARRPRFAG